MKDPIRSLAPLALLPSLLALACALPARADFDPEDDRFDPEKVHTITADGAILGDPSPFLEMGLDRPGYTYTNQALVPEAGARVVVSLMIPLREGESVSPGGGALSLSLEEAKAFSEALRKGPEWAKVAKDNEVGEYSKEIATVQGESGEGDGLSLVFLSDAEHESAVIVEQRLAGTAKRYRFSINAAVKLASAVDHFAALARELHGKPGGGDSLPKGDAERDALFQ